MPMHKVMAEADNTALPMVMPVRMAAVVGHMAVLMEAVVHMVAVPADHMAVAMAAAAREAEVMAVDTEVAAATGNDRLLFFSCR